MYTDNTSIIILKGVRCGFSAVVFLRGIGININEFPDNHEDAMARRFTKGLVHLCVFEPWWLPPAVNLS
jgi:hypothetical protein